VGPLTVKVPRNRSLVPSIKPFVSALIPKYMRKTLHIEEALPLFLPRRPVEQRFHSGV
ncbi:MAG: hypothetical protein HGB15_07990, partial [Chlorobaculum sp.]|nr:hypothetical protein [Chlorobaculum sp.]